jgi:hypothetical protein
MQDVINDIKFIEDDSENVANKCEKENCAVLYNAIVATIKLLCDLLFCNSMISSCLVYRQPEIKSRSQSSHSEDMSINHSNECHTS